MGKAPAPVPVARSNPLYVPLKHVRGELPQRRRKRISSCGLAE